MSEFFTLGPLTQPGPPVPDPDEVARGDAWSVRLAGGRHVLEYWSGELADHLRSLDISEDETAQLRDGTIDIDAVLLAHGAL